MIRRAIIIGAGRGERLMPTTRDTPKCFAEVHGKRILDWTVEAFQENGVEEIIFIGGYQIEKVRAAYPDFTFRHNDDWQNNNILASLFYAADQMDGPFVCCYSDILIRPSIIAGLLADEETDIALSVDTDWLERYEHRSEHPSDDAEKVVVENGAVTRIHREIPETDAHGEYTGVARFSDTGARRLRENYDRLQQQFAGKPFRESTVFEKAYLIHMLQDMIESGERMTHVDTPGGYIEIDTQEDFEYARRNW